MSIRTPLRPSAALAPKVLTDPPRPLAGVLLALLLLSPLCAQADDDGTSKAKATIIIRVLVLSGLHFDGIPEFEETAIYGVSASTMANHVEGQQVPLSLILGQAPRRFSLSCSDPYEPKTLLVSKSNSSVDFTIQAIPSLQCPFGVDRGFKRGFGALYLWIETSNPSEPLKLRKRSEVLTAIVRHLATRTNSDQPNPFAGGGFSDHGLMTLFTAIPTTSDVPEEDRRQLIESLKRGTEAIVSDEVSLNLEIARLLLGDRSVFDNWMMFPDQGPAWGLDLKTRAINLLAQAHDDPKFRGRLLLPLLKSARGEKIQGADRLLRDLREGRIVIEAPPEVAKVIERGLAAHAKAGDLKLIALIPLLGAIAIFAWAFVVRRSTQFMLFR